MWIQCWIDIAYEKRCHHYRFEIVLNRCFDRTQYLVLSHIHENRHGISLQPIQLFLCHFRTIQWNYVHLSKWEIQRSHLTTSQRACIQNIVYLIQSKHIFSMLISICLGHTIWRISTLLLLHNLQGLTDCFSSFYDHFKLTHRQFRGNLNIQSWQQQ